MAAGRLTVRPRAWAGAARDRPSAVCETAGVTDLHPAAAPLSFLLGSWSGEGRGTYPTIDDFAYREWVTFGHTGKPFLVYTQRTADAATGAPMHAETGYLRAVGEGRVELVLAQPSGITEIHAGTVEGTTLRLATTEVGVAPTAKRVDALERELTVDGDVLTYAVRMAAMGLPMTHHLAAELRREAGA